MAKIILGKTGLKIEKNGFGALPIQRASFDETKEIVQKAYANGINFLMQMELTFMILQEHTPIVKKS